MSIANLQQVESFGAFLDFLTNPEKYKSMMDDAKATIAEYHKAVGVYRELQQVYRYQATLKKEHQDQQARLQQELEQIDGRKKKFVEYEKATAKDIETAQQKLNKQILIVTEREKKADILEKKLAETTALETRLHNQQREVNEKIAALTARDAAIRAAVG